MHDAGAVTLFDGATSSSAATAATSSRAAAATTSSTAMPRSTCASVCANLDGTDHRDRQLRQHGADDAPNGERHLQSRPAPHRARDPVLRMDPTSTRPAFSGALADYTFTVDGVATAAAGLVNVGQGHIVTVTDNVGTDGVDTVPQHRAAAILRPVARPGRIEQSAGRPADDSRMQHPRKTSSLTVSIAGVTDGARQRGCWATQREAFPHPLPTSGRSNSYAASGVFTDILIDFAAGEVARSSGPTFTPGDGEAGLRLRVRAIYKDANGVLEEVFSAPTAAVENVNDPPVGTVLISDVTPTETQPLTAINAFTDADGRNHAGRVRLSVATICPGWRHHIH